MESWSIIFLSMVSCSHDFFGVKILTLVNFRFLSSIP